MGKSSSLKKKRSKNSSQSRARKRNKFKSWRNKSKKLRHLRDASVSYSSDSDSISLLSFSPSSLEEDDYRSLRSRPQSRNKKDVKKRARRHSSSRESIEDSPHVKKRRASRRDNDFEKRKTTSKRKRSRRDVSVSSLSSAAQSCSTCWSGRSIDHDDVRFKKRGRSEKEKEGRRSDKVKRGSGRIWNRSGSCSSCSRHDEGSDHPIEGSYPRRLKSVIIVIKNENESSRVLNTDDAKEIYGYDDHPSCRSNDSNGDSNRRDLPLHSHVLSETKRLLDDEQGQFYNIRTSSLEESGKDYQPSYDLREKNKVSSDTGGLNGDDMELILRQLALENLRKFRGGLQRIINPPIIQNDASDSVGNTPPSVNTDPSWIKTPKEDDTGVLIASHARQQIKQPPVGRDSTIFPKTELKTSHLNDSGKDTRNQGSCLPSPPSQVALATIPRVEVNSVNKSVSNSRLVSLRARQEPSDAYATLKQEAAAQEPSTKWVSTCSVIEGGLEAARIGKPSEDNVGINYVSNRPKSIKSRIRRESPSATQEGESVALEPSEAKLVTESIMNSGDSGTAQAVKPAEDSDKDGKVNNSHVLACDMPPSTSTSGHISSDKPEDETEDDSQFQQKKMSVMRGGEMVQVSYQVYIPKRAPALARRQLKR